MTTHIRMATLDDAGAVRDIYSPYIVDSCISFEEKVPSVAEIQGRIQKVMAHFPWLVCEIEGVIAGYAYAGAHRERAAYRWSTDVSVYVHQEYHRRGIGKALYTALFDLLVHQGYINAYAGVTLPNAGSVGLHEAMGFVSVGVYHNIGYKFGRWHDVGWWEYTLQERPVNPPEPKSIHSLDQALIAKTLDSSPAQVRP